MIDDPMGTLELPSLQHGAETSMVLEELPENEYDESARGDRDKGNIFTGDKADKISKDSDNAARESKDGDGGGRYSNLK
jgi:hypothetical protein